MSVVHATVRQHSHAPTREGAASLRITQVRSQIGQGPNARRNMRALGLHGKIGRSRVHEAAPQTWGKIRKVRHLVSVELLPEALAKEPIGAAVMTARAYEVLAHPALIVRAGSEYAIGEKYDGYYSYTWTARVSAQQALRTFERAIGREHAVDIRFQGSSRPLDGFAAARKALSMEKDVVAYSVDYEMGTLSWSPGGNGQQLAEVSVLSPELGPEFCESLMVETATSAISHESKELLSQFSFVWA